MNKDVFKIGTLQCGVFCAVCGVILAVLLLTIGLGKTLFIFAFAGAGLFIGLVKDKKNALRRAINHIPSGEQKIDNYEDLKNKD